MEGTIRSRKPIRPGISGNRSPPQGSPIRQNYRQLSPNLSGSDNEDYDDTTDLELNNCQNATATTSSTMNSSLDVPDGDNIRMSYSHRERKAEFFPDGRVKTISVIEKKKGVAVSKAKPDTNNYGLLLIVLIIVVGVCLAFIYFRNYDRNAVVDDRTRHKRCSFERSQHDFPNQNEILWKSLEHGVESVLNVIPTSPSIFLLAYEDVKSANRITQSIVQRTTECMASTANALELSPADLAKSEMKSDYGIVIKKYKNKLKTSGVMLVNDLNKVPGEVAQAFHVFCDVDNPLVDRSIIFLTLQLPGQIDSSSGSNALGLIENYLRSNWSGLEDNILGPLITRVTDQVFVLNKE